MKEYQSSVSPKGQVTIPLEVRKRWHLGPNDRVIFQVDGDAVRILPVQQALDEIFQSIPALCPPLSDKEQTRIAAEEHAQHVAREGLPS